MSTDKKITTLEVRTFVNESMDFAVRVMDRKGEPWFVGSDAARALGYSRPRDAVADHCKGGVKLALPSMGGMQETVIIPESDLYRLILRSRLPQAEAFQDWVVEEVLPTIRRRGGYGEALGLEGIFAFLQEERQARLQFEKTITDRLFPAPQPGPPRPSVIAVRDRIIEYIRQAGPNGLPLHVVTNRIRHMPERREAIRWLLADGLVLEVIRNRKHFFILSPFKQS